MKKKSRLQSTSGDGTPGVRDERRVEALGEWDSQSLHCWG